MTREGVSVTEYLAEEGVEAFRHAVVYGLRQPQKRLPCKYFYDARGCELFDQICELEEYYPTRTELAILRHNISGITAAIGSRVSLIEFGSGSSVKTRVLLEHLDDPAAYVPVDIARDYLEEAARGTKRLFGTLEVLPVCANFLSNFSLPEPAVSPQRRVVFFPGSTIGNLTPDDALTLLKRIVELIGPGGGLLIGLDLQKDVATLEAAYNDRQGITAQFNLNLLNRINRELGARIGLENFRHRAFYNPDYHRIEMHLVSVVDQRVAIGNETFLIAEGETICTEYSHKYDLDKFAEMAADAGLLCRRRWTDDRQFFGIMFLEAASR